MYSYFLRRCNHCHTAILCDVPNQEKKNPVLDEPPPPLCIQMCSSSLKPMQIPRSNVMASVMKSCDGEATSRIAQSTTHKSVWGKWPYSPTIFF